MRISPPSSPTCGPSSRFTTRSRSPFRRPRSAQASERSTSEMEKAMNRKKILVFGATGAQGGSVARNLLARGRFDVRAITRKADSPAAQALRELGAELVQGDLDDPASLRAALEGCYGAFGVTNFWEHFAKEREQGHNL